MVDIITCTTKKAFNELNICSIIARVYPKGEDGTNDHMSLYLHVANPESLRLGWKIRANYSFALLNQSGKELHRTRGSLLF